MSRVFTTDDGNNKFTLNVLDKNDVPQLILTVNGPLPEELAKLSAKATGGDEEAAKKYVGEFIRLSHEQGALDWASSNNPIVKH